MRYLVSLVSEQTIPNVLLIKCIRNIDRYLFITTERMTDNGRLNALISFCPGGAQDVISVDELDPQDINSKLAEFYVPDSQSSYIVNITGGTKLMALAAYEFFRSRPAQILYMPPNGNCAQLLHPSMIKDFLHVDYRLSVQEYFWAYGFETLYSATLLHEYSLLEKMFQFFSRNSDAQFMENINRLGSKGASHSEEQKRIKRHIVQDLSIPSDRINEPEWLNFIKGGWFEEYLQYHLQLYLYNDIVYRNIITEKNYVKNEIDLCFTHANAIYVWELKSSVQFKDIKDKLYKLDSIRREFGMFPRCFLAIANQGIERQLREAPYIQHRAAKMGITILLYSDLVPDKIAARLKELLLL